MDIRVSWKSILLFWAIAVAFWLVATFADVLLIIFAAALLATFIAPVVSSLQRRGVPRWLATLFIYFDLVAAAGVVFYLAAPLAINETAALLSQLPTLTAGIYDYLTSLPGFNEFAAQLPTSTELTNRLILQLAALAQSVRDIVFAIATIAIDLLVVLVAAYFFTVDEQFVVRLVQALVPIDRRAAALDLLKESGARMRGWVIGQMVVTIYFAAAFSLGLWLIGVPYALSLGFISGTLEIIPFIGGFIGATLAMVVAFAKDPILALWVLALHLVVSNIEAHVLVPYVYSRAFRIHPLVVILALLFGVRLFGLVGALLSVPAAAALQVAVEQLYMRDIIRKSKPTTGHRHAG